MLFQQPDLVSVPDPKPTPAPHEVWGRDYGQTMHAWLMHGTFMVMAFM